MDALRRFLLQMRQYWGGLSLARRAAIVVAAVGVFVALGIVVYLSQSATFRPLFTDLAPEEAGTITTRLTAANIPNRLAAGGTAVEVPENQLAQARVAVAAEGLPARGGKGYELFDETSLLTTPFVQSVNYQRALQAELARSITQIESVQSARVMIARPEPTPFVRDQRAPTASVIVKLKPGATMSRATAASIVSLVARSVEGLKPENVTVVDSGGRLLSDPHAGDRDNLPAPQLEYRRELETYLANKAEQMLAQALGPGRAVVRVSADINFQQVKERQETFLPNPVVGAERLTTIRTSGGGAPRGIAGAVSNVPRAGAPLPSPGGTGGGSSSNEELVQTDYAVSRSVRDLEDRMGGVTRLNVAALVDLNPPEGGGPVMSAADAQAIIEQAVGFRGGRDEVKLTNVRLGGPVGPPEPDETLVRLQRFQAYVSLARNVSLALAIVLALALVPLVLLRRRPAPVAPVPPPEPPRPTEEERRRAELSRLAEMARTEPDRVAAIFRMLVGGR
jgi:flagellar M-ring protein FliF